MTELNIYCVAHTSGTLVPVRKKTSTRCNDYELVNSKLGFAARAGINKGGRFKAEV